MASTAFRKIESSKRLRRAVSVRRTRWVKRGSSVDTARSMSVMLFFISTTGEIVAGGAGFSSTVGFSSAGLASEGFISTSGMVDCGREVVSDRI